MKTPIPRRADLLAIPMRRRLMQALAASSLLGGGPASASSASPTSAAVPPVQPFALNEVALLDGPFRRAQQLDLRYLISLNANRLLHNFHANAGLPPKAPVYGGWESEQLCPGHTLGHYLSACSMMWSSTGHAGLLDRVNYLVRELASCQVASRRGLVCGFPDDDAQLRNVVAGRKVIGVPWYTIHKILAGLRDAHVHAHQPQALGVLTAMADWIDAFVAPLDDARFEKMLELEHGGMSEILADLHGLTGEPRYLRLAERFTERAVVQPLSEERDILDGQHANTMIPKVLGAARLHAITGQPGYQKAARYFWGEVVNQRSFATGGHGENEFFLPAADTRNRLASAKTMETCCTYNMLRLTHTLFAAAPSAAYADYAERALLNGILGSQDPDSGMFTYFQATRPNYPKLYSSPEQSFWCCTGTGMENHAKYGESIYYHAGDTLYLNQFIASRLQWREQGVQVTQRTGFPDTGSTRLTFDMRQARELSLWVRHPGWCTHLVVRLNGTLLRESRQPGRYLELRRIWRAGDVLDIEMPMHVYLAPLPGAPDFAALMYGPVVLAARLGQAGMRAGGDISASNRAYGTHFNEARTMPRLHVGSARVQALVQRADGPALAFKLTTASAAEQFDLVPFHQVAHERYNMYWNVG